MQPPFTSSVINYICIHFRIHIMEYRIERDSIGEVKVSADKYWAAQTQRSVENFKIGSQTMPIEIIKAFGVLKKCAAMANAELGVLTQ